MALPVRCEIEINKPDGTHVQCKESLCYLGSLLTALGSIAPKLSNRIGAARAEFHTLKRIWAHSSLSIGKKIRILHACVLSRLLYCLHTAWLKKAGLQKLHAFQSMCLRQIQGIPHSYISRVSNAEVLRRAGEHPVSKTLLHRQLLLLARIAALPSEDVRRRCIFQGDRLELLQAVPRKRGRPKQTWASEVRKQALLCAGSEERLQGSYVLLFQGRLAHLPFHAHVSPVARPIFDDVSFFGGCKCRVFVVIITIVIWMLAAKFFQQAAFYHKQVKLSGIPYCVLG